MRKSDRDAPWRTLCALRSDASHSSRGVPLVLDGKSSSSGGDDRCSNDANTSHVPSKHVRTTIPANSPSTKANAMRTMRQTRTSRR